MGFALVRVTGWPPGVLLFPRADWVASVSTFSPASGNGRKKKLQKRTCFQHLGSTASPTHTQGLFFKREAALGPSFPCAASPPANGCLPVAQGLQVSFPGSLCSAVSLRTSLSLINSGEL